MMTTAGIIAVTIFNHPSHQNQHVVVPPPTTYQSGIIVNNVTQTFPFDWEWPCRFAQGTQYTVRIIFKSGLGVNAIWARTDEGSNLLQPFLNSGTLNSTNREFTWTGQISMSSPYKLELGNLADENNMATIQVYISDN